MASVIEQDGKAVRMVGICRDVTDRQKLLRELRARAKQQEIVARLGERALTESDLQALFDEIVSTIAETLHVEFVKILELEPGDAELLLRAGFGWRAGAVGTAHESTGRHSQAGYALASGGPIIVTDLKSETRFEIPALLRDHGADSGVSVPIAGRDGPRLRRARGAYAGRRRFGEHEVSFVVAVANLIAGAIQRRQADPAPRADDPRIAPPLRQPVRAIARAVLADRAHFAQRRGPHRQIRRRASSRSPNATSPDRRGRLAIDLAEGAAARAARALYRPRHAFRARRFISNPTLFALSSALHELATNASKYGSLSSATGTLDLSWTVQRGEAGLRLELDWKERGGPLPKRARRVGFGSRLIGMVIGAAQRQCHAHLRAERPWRRSWWLPLSHERWPGEVAGASEAGGEPLPGEPD
jgi:hypothetical protein